MRSPRSEESTRIDHRCTTRVRIPPHAVRGLGGEIAASNLHAGRIVPVWPKRQSLNVSIDVSSGLIVTLRDFAEPELGLHATV